MKINALLLVLFVASVCSENIIEYKFMDKDVIEDIGKVKKYKLPLVYHDTSSNKRKHFGNHVILMEAKKGVYMETQRSFMFLKDALLTNKTLNVTVKFTPPKLKYVFSEYCIFCVKKDDDLDTVPQSNELVYNPMDVCKAYDFAVTWVGNMVRVFFATGHDIQGNCLSLSTHVHLNEISVGKPSVLRVSINEQKYIISIDGKVIYRKSMTPESFDIDSWAADQRIYIGPLKEPRFEGKNIPIMTLYHIIINTEVKQGIRHKKEKKSVMSFFTENDEIDTGSGKMVEHKNSHQPTSDSEHSMCKCSEKLCDCPKEQQLPETECETCFAAIFWTYTNKMNRDVTIPMSNITMSVKTDKNVSIKTKHSFPPTLHINQGNHWIVYESVLEFKEMCGKIGQVGVIIKANDIIISHASLEYIGHQQWSITNIPISHSGLYLTGRIPKKQLELRIFQKTLMRNDLEIIQTLPTPQKIEPYSTIQNMPNQTNPYLQWITRTSIPADPLFEPVTEYYLVTKRDNKKVHYINYNTLNHRYGHSINTGDLYGFVSDNIQGSTILTPPTTGKSNFETIKTLNDVEIIGPFRIYQCIRIVPSNPLGIEVLSNGKFSRRYYSMDFCLRPRSQETIKQEMARINNVQTDAVFMSTKTCSTKSPPVAACTKYDNCGVCEGDNSKCKEMNCGDSSACVEQYSSCDIVPPPRYTDNHEDILNSVYTFYTNTTIFKTNDVVELDFKCKMPKTFDDVHFETVPLIDSTCNSKAPLYQRIGVVRVKTKDLFECSTGKSYDPNTLEVWRGSVSMILKSLTSFTYKIPCNYKINPRADIEKHNKTEHDPTGSIFITEFSTHGITIVPKIFSIKTYQDDIFFTFSLCYKAKNEMTSITIVSQEGPAIEVVPYENSDFAPCHKVGDTCCHLWKIRTIDRYFRYNLWLKTRMKIRITGVDWHVDEIIDLGPLYHKSNYVIKPPKAVVRRTRKHGLKLCYFSDERLTIPFKKGHKKGKRVYIKITAVYNEKNATCSGTMCPFSDKSVQLRIPVMNICVPHGEKHDKLKSCNAIGMERRTLLDTRSGRLKGGRNHNVTLTYDANCTSSAVVSFVLSDCFVGKPLDFEVLSTIEENDPFLLEFTGDNDGFDRFLSSDPLSPVECNDGEWYDEYARVCRGPIAALFYRILQYLPPNLRIFLVMFAFVGVLVYCLGWVYPRKEVNYEPEYIEHKKTDNSEIPETDTNSSEPRQNNTNNVPGDIWGNYNKMNPIGYGTFNGY